MNSLAPAVAAGLLIAANLAIAGPADYIYTPSYGRASAIRLSWD
jgi:hypothetical protein